jgi:hypothetical protein
MNLDWVLAALPWLAFLACPVVMFWMMRGGGCGRQPDADQEQGPPPRGSRRQTAHIQRCD